MLETLITIVATGIITVGGQKYLSRVEKRRLAPLILRAFEGYVDSASRLAESFEKHECGDFVFAPDTIFIETHMDKLHWYGSEGYSIITLHSAVKGWVKEVNGINERGAEAEFEGIPKTPTTALVQGMDKIVPLMQDVVRQFRKHHIN